MKQVIVIVERKERHSTRIRSRRRRIRTFLATDWNPGESRRKIGHESATLSDDSDLLKDLERFRVR